VSYEPPSIEQRISGGLVGLLVGDALGVPYEFHRATDIPAFELIEMSPPADFRRAHGVPPGTWSDDGAQALCLLASLLAKERLDIHDLANRLRNWEGVGYMAVDFAVFDVGVQTQRALQRLAVGVAPAQAGLRGESDNGNGSLMRVLPLALWHRTRSSGLAADAGLQSSVTHGHARSRLCCAFLCFLACGLLQGESVELAWQRSADELRPLVGPDSEDRDELEFILDRSHAAKVSGSGYVLDSLWSARHCLEQASDFESAVRRAIQLGNDTDTTACIVGGLAGVIHGINGMPRRWREQLRGAELYQPLLSALLARESSG
jgi:ADP-ribosyl-[dinitrogen reductase] hydrolase